MEKFKRGDKVFCKAFGHGVVEHIARYAISPVLVRFGHYLATFRHDGRYTEICNKDYYLRHATKLDKYLYEGNNE